MFKMKMVLSSRLDNVAIMFKMFNFLTETLVMLPVLSCDNVAVVELIAIL